MTRKTSVRLIALSLFAGLALSACGKKGPLEQHPDRDKKDDKKGTVVVLL